MRIALLERHRGRRLEGAGLTGLDAPADGDKDKGAETGEDALHGSHIV